MSSEFDLFGEVPPPSEQAAPVPAATARLKVAASPRVKLSPAQQRFNKLLSRIENLTAQNQHVNTMLDRFRPGHLQAVAALEQQTADTQKNMLLFLHERLQRKGLTAPQQKSVRSIVKSLLLVLEPQEYPEVEALFDLYHTPEEQAELEEEEAQSKQELKAMLEQMAGRPLDHIDTDQSHEEMVQAALGHIQQAQAAQENKREARKAKRAPTAKQRAAEQQQVDAKTTLRTIFRQLASALHPDREPDPAERARKTTLMSEVNAAYERNDLTTLLRLQMQIEQLDADSIARMADEKLAAMSLLLKEQVGALEEDLAMTLHRVEAELGLWISPETPEAMWARYLENIQLDMRETVHSMQEDLLRVQSDEELKRWLKEQTRMAKEIARERADWERFGGF